MIAPTDMEDLCNEIECQNCTMSAKHEFAGVGSTSALGSLAQSRGRAPMWVQGAKPPEAPAI